MQAGAIAAYNAGATGAGVLAAVIDSGIIPTNAEFAGRIHPASADLVGSRGIIDEGGHGTSVASVLLGAKNDAGTHGVAFGATLLVARTDTPGSCTDPSPDAGCSHGDNAIARGVDLAVANRARVINMSLGGSPANATLRSAIDRATAAGVIIVFSAGNDFDTDPTVAANPDPFAQIANDPLARGLILIAGALDSSNTALTNFSNRAGNGAATYIGALGRRVAAIDETGNSVPVSGTSFSAPIVSGAVALLAQAFPNLSSAQIVDLLLRTATDLGAPGTDTIFGRGALDIARAFAPQGSANFAGSAIPVSLINGGTSAAPIGDAQQTGTAAVILDGYGRAYTLDLGSTVKAGAIAPRLAQGLGIGSQSRMTGGANSAVSLSVASAGSTARADRLLLSAHEQQQTRALAGAMFTRLSRDTVAAFGIMQGGASLKASLTGEGGPAFLVGQQAGRDWGFQSRAKSAFAISHQIGATRLSVVGETGEATMWQRALLDGSRPDQKSSRYGAVGISADRRFGPFLLNAGVTTLTESDTLLGARFGGFAGVSGARTLFADAGIALALGRGWSLGGAWRQGWTRLRAGGLRDGADQLRSTSWSVDLTGQNVALRGDHFGLRVSQPLRVSQGGFNLTLPTGYDYASLSTTTGSRFFNLAPTGREIDVEAVWSARLGGGWIGTNLFWRRDPGNIAAAPDDVGVAVRYNLGL